MTRYLPFLSAFAFFLGALLTAHPALQSVALLLLYDDTNLNFAARRNLEPCALQLVLPYCPHKIPFEPLLVTDADLRAIFFRDTLSVLHIPVYSSRHQSRVVTRLGEATVHHLAIVATIVRNDCSELSGLGFLSQLLKSSRAHFRAKRRAFLWYTALFITTCALHAMSSSPPGQGEDRSRKETHSPRQAANDAIDDSADVDGDFADVQRTISQKRRQEKEAAKKEISIQEILPFHFSPIVRPLTVSDLESCVALENAAFSEEHRASREKVNNPSPWLVPSGR